MIAIEEVMKTGTTTVGLVCKDGIVLADQSHRCGSRLHDFFHSNHSESVLGLIKFIWYIKVMVVESVELLWQQGQRVYN